ncbi:MAG: 50S ribosomal protein L18 [Minisyncoccia bacterium]
MTMTKATSRIRRHKRVRAKVIGTLARPRLAVHKSNRFISVQLINDDTGKTMAAAHGREFSGSLGKQAEVVGKTIAERAQKLGVSSVVFDRGGYQYAAQIKSLADAARAGGLIF